jgi:hypothetical protein
MHSDPHSHRHLQAEVLTYVLRWVERLHESCLPGAGLT